MCNLFKGLGVLSLLAVVAVPATPKPAPEEDQSSIVIVLKDGRRQSFRLVDIARIEFTRLPGRTSSRGRTHFLGRWKVGVGDGSDKTFFITLKPDGQAHKTFGSREGGIWVISDGEARISWDDGWHDVIRKAGNKYQKVAYAPSSGFAGEPANVTDAEYTDPL